MSPRLGHLMGFLLLNLALVTAAHAGNDAASPAATDDNALLAQWFAQDQAARQDGPDIDWKQLLESDRQRRVQVMQVLAQGGVRTAADYYHAAMVFQHGDGLQDIQLAHALASVAAALVPEEKKYRWLSAASWDRIMVTQLQPQWYGTQFKADAQGAYLYPLAEEAVTDAERVAMGVPTVAESRARVAQAAAMTGTKVRAEPPTLEQLRAEAGAAKEP